MHRWSYTQNLIKSEFVTVYNFPLLWVRVRPRNYLFHLQHCNCKYVEMLLLWLVVVVVFHFVKNLSTNFVCVRIVGQNLKVPRHHICNCWLLKMFYIEFVNIFVLYKVILGSNPCQLWTKAQRFRDHLCLHQHCDARDFIKFSRHESFKSYIFMLYLYTKFHTLGGFSGSVIFTIKPKA
jgi:hypothetical protein